MSQSCCYDVLEIATAGYLCVLFGGAQGAGKRRFLQQIALYFRNQKGNSVNKVKWVLKSQLVQEKCESEGLLLARTHSHEKDPERWSFGKGPGAAEVLERGNNNQRVEGQA